MDNFRGYRVEVDVGEDKWHRNGQVWPDWVSADLAGADLFSRWLLVRAYRVTGVDEEPNQPTWEEYVRKFGAPARSVSL